MSWKFTKSTTHLKLNNCWNKKGKLSRERQFYTCLFNSIFSTNIQYDNAYSSKVNKTLLGLFDHHNVDYLFIYSIIWSSQWKCSIVASSDLLFLSLSLSLSTIISSRNFQRVLLFFVHSTKPFQALEIVFISDLRNIISLWVTDLDHHFSSMSLWFVICSLKSEKDIVVTHYNVHTHTQQQMYFSSLLSTHWQFDLYTMCVGIMKINWRVAFIQSKHFF